MAGGCGGLTRTDLVDVLIIYCYCQSVSSDESSLQKEIKQSRPFRTKSQEALLSLLKTADLMRRIVTGVLEPYGVTMQQYNVLRILRGAGEEPLPTLAIRDRMIEQATSMGANAVVNVRFATSSISQGAAELFAYGTAVRVS